MLTTKPNYNFCFPYDRISSLCLSPCMNSRYVLPKRGYKNALRKKNSKVVEGMIERRIIGEKEYHSKSFPFVSSHSPI